MIIAVIGDKGMFGQDMVSLLRSRGENVAGFNRLNLDFRERTLLKSYIT
jgi:dTDP-4-dehydrorhamnose reductase